MFSPAAPLFLSFFTNSAPGYTGSPSPSTTAASFVFTVMPPKGVAIFTLSLPFLLSDSIRQPLVSAVTAISVATTTVWLFRIFRLHMFTKQYAAFAPLVPARQYPPCFTPYSGHKKSPPSAATLPQEKLQTTPFRWPILTHAGP